MRITIPIKTLSEANQREHWAKKAKRARAQRAAVYLSLRAEWGTPPQAPYAIFGRLVVTLTRIAPRILDQGNLEASFKAVQDGVADWLAGEYGKGQDRMDGLHWAYAQARGAPHEYAVQVTITQEGEQQ